MSAEPRQTTANDAWMTWQNQVVQGRFALRRCLGWTDHSAVFLTEHKAKNLAEAAIKFVRADAPQAQTLLLHWQAAVNLSHAHLVQLFEVGRYESGGHDYQFVVMEYADQTLAEILRRRPLGAEELQELLPPVLEALTFLHRRQLVHGQLKPSNFLAVGDQLKLASDTIRPAGQDHGTSTAGDVWSLGATLVEAITARGPISSEQRFDVASLPAGLPASLVDTVQRCLSPSPAERPSVIELRAENKPAAPQATPAAKPEPPKQKVSQEIAQPPRPAETASRVASPIQPAPSSLREVASAQPANAGSREATQRRPVQTASGISSQPQSAPSASREVTSPQIANTAQRATVPAQPLPSSSREAPPFQVTQTASRVAVSFHPVSDTSRVVAQSQPAPSILQDVAAPQIANTPPRVAAPAQPAPSASRVAPPPQPAPSTSRAAAPSQPVPSTSREVAPTQVVNTAPRVAAPAQLAPNISRQVDSPQAANTPPRVAASSQPLPSAPREPAPPKPAPSVARVAAPPPPAPSTSREAAPSESPPKRHLSIVGIAAGGLLLIIAVWIGWRSAANSPAALQPPAVSASTPITRSAPANVATTEPTPTAPISPPQPEATSSSILNEVMPTVPDKIQNKIQGRVYVTVRVLVDPAGNVMGVLMENAGPSKYFARLSDQAARDWQFVAADTDAARVWLLRFEYTRKGVSVRTFEQ
jgi:serine/threonine protein kinase